MVAIAPTTRAPYVTKAKRGEQPTEAQRPYQPHGAAETLLYCKAPEVLLSGPANTGKSRACLEKLHICASKYAGMRGLILRKTRTAVTESALVTFEDKVLPEGSPIKDGPKREQRHVYRYPNGSEIVVGGLDDPQKVHSTEYDLIYVMEAIELTEDEWERLSIRNRNKKMPYQQLIADCNPDTPTHWLLQRCRKQQTLMLESRHTDNPTFSAEDQARLDALTGVRRKRLRDGLWVAAEGQVWEDFDPALHVLDSKPIPASWPRLLIVDFGFTHPFVAQWWARDDDGRLYRYREIHRRQRLVEDHAKQMATYMKGEPWPRQIICDHDAEDRATLERHLAKHTGRTVETTRAIKNVSAGIQAVGVRLRKAGDGKPRLFFLRGALVERDPIADETKAPACTEEEIPGYVWPRGADGRFIKEAPVKEGDDGCDTTRYAVAACDLTHKGVPLNGRFG